MILKDLIKNANDILGLTIDWQNTSEDDNYQQLFACARLVLNSMMGIWEISDNTRKVCKSVNVITFFIADFSVLY